LLTGVLALKNASQFAVMAAAVPALALALDEAAGELVMGDEEEVADDAGGELEPEPLGLLLPQAAVVAASATSAHTPTRREICL
jgi:hypothetical protein